MRLIFLSDKVSKKHSVDIKYSMRDVNIVHRTKNGRQ